MIFSARQQDLFAPVEPQHLFTSNLRRSVFRLQLPTRGNSQFRTFTSPEHPSFAESLNIGVAQFFLFS